VDAAVSDRPDAALLAVAGQEDGARFDAIGAGVAEVKAVGIEGAGIRRGRVVDVDLAHRFLPRR